MPHKRSTPIQPTDTNNNHSRARHVPSGNGRARPTTAGGRKSQRNSTDKKVQRTPKQIFGYQVKNVQLWVWQQPDGEGGTAAFQRLSKNGEIRVEAETSLTETQFVILDTLMKAADEPHDAPNWVPKGYVPSSQLKLALLKSLGTRFNPQTLAKKIFHLRAKLQRVAEESLKIRNGRDWARDVLESNSQGYRLSIPPNRQHLGVVVKTSSG